ncbi:MAG: hypothetical protein NC548_59430 [Lachnospiraceae bacterium]|nr:hypothetical protein [Lachnospiraceae bacterium]
MAAKQIQNNINSVTISYNGKQKEFGVFLESIIKNYVFNNDISVCENNIPYKMDIEKEL